MSDHQHRQVPTTKLALEVPDGSNLDGLIGALVGAINRHADAIAPPETSLARALAANGNSTVLSAIANLTRKVDTMSSNIDRIEKEAADAAENVELVRKAVGDLKSASEAMQAEIASLREQVAQGQVDQARLDAAAAAFEKADDDIDAIVLPGAEPPPSEG